MFTGLLAGYGWKRTVQTLAADGTVDPTLGTVINVDNSAGNPLAAPAVGAAALVGMKLTFVRITATANTCIGRSVGPRTPSTAPPARSRLGAVEGLHARAHRGEQLGDRVGDLIVKVRLLALERHRRRPARGRCDRRHAGPHRRVHDPRRRLRRCGRHAAGGASGRRARAVRSTRTPARRTSPPTMWRRRPTSRSPTTCRR